MNLKVPILTYHNIESDSSPISISKGQFQQQMRWLNQMGCKVISMDQLVGHITKAEPIHEKTVVLTFDDGFESVFTVGAPIMVELGFSATIMIVPGYAGKLNDWPSQPSGLERASLLSWSQIEELSQMGFEVGSHSLTHPLLPAIGKSELQQEVSGSKLYLEDKLGVPVNAFTYPYGCFNEQIRDLVSKYYLSASTSKPGFATEVSDIYTIERIDVNYLPTRSIFHSLYERWMPGYLGLRRILSRIAGKVLDRTWC